MKFTRRFLIYMIILFGKLLILRTYIFGWQALFPALLYEAIPLAFFLGIGALCCRQRFYAYFIIFDFILSLYALSAELYYDYFGRFLDFRAISQASMLFKIKSSVIELLALHHLIYFLDLVILMALRQAGRIHSSSQNSGRYSGRYKRNKRILVSTLVCFIFLAGWIIFIPAQQNIMALARNYGIINAQLYDICTLIDRPKTSTLEKEAAIDISKLSQLKQINAVQWPKYFGTAAGYNLITVQLESTENFVIGLSLNGQEVTPNLNRLIQESVYFPNFYSQIGQGNTSDAEFVVNTSIYPRAKGAVSTDFIGLSYPSLPRLLKEQGYASLTFHPNAITFWRRDNLYPCLGFDKVYEKKFYQDEDLLGPWGSSDEMLFKKALPVLKAYGKSKQKFYASLITLTNHHPYQIPEDRKKLQLPEQLRNTFLGNYLSSVNYQDYALGLFIQDLKAAGLWENTLFVVYGDHFGINKSQEKENQKFFALLLGREHDSIDSLNVPLIIRAPSLKPQIIGNVGGQVDILPTLANLMGIPVDNHFFFGQDILNYETNLLGFRFYYPEGTFISSDLFHLAGSAEAVSIKNRQKIAEPELIAKDEQRLLALMNLSDYYLNTLVKKAEP